MGIPSSIGYCRNRYWVLEPVIMSSKISMMYYRINKLHMASHTMARMK